MAGQMHYGFIASNVGPQSRGIVDNVFMSAIRQRGNKSCDYYSVQHYFIVTLWNFFSLALQICNLQLKYCLTALFVVGTRLSRTFSWGLAHEPRLPTCLHKRQQTVTSGRLQFGDTASTSHRLQGCLVENQSGKNNWP